jgi:hypothetical protein
VREHCKVFAESPGIKEGSLALLQQWIACLDSLTNQRKAWPAFIFMMQHREDLFFYKKRKIGWPSHFKHAIRLIQTHLRHN